MRTFLTVSVLALGIGALVLQTGCEKRSEVDTPAIQQPQYEMIVMIQLDTSGSFRDILQRKGHRFCMAVIDKYFRNRMGSNDRLILAQISGTNRSLFWDGQPRNLKHDYPSEQAFTNFLMSRPDPGGSRVFDSMADGLEYLTTYPGVPEGKTKVAAICLTDMDDNFPDMDKSKARLVKAMTEWDDLNEIFQCDHCLASRPDKTPWTAEAGEDGFYRVVNSDSVVIAQKCVKEEAQLFAMVPMLLKECEIQCENWQMLLSGEWNGSEEGIHDAINGLQTVINQAHGKES